MKFLKDLLCGGVCFAAIMSVAPGAEAQSTTYLGAQYGLPNPGFNEGGGCATGYASCFTIPHGRRLRQCRGTFTNKVGGVSVLWSIECNGGIVWAGEYQSTGTWNYSTSQLSQTDSAFLGNGQNICAIYWQADNNTGAPVPAGAAFEIQGVCSMY
jgi:hypothetical protein